MAFSFFENRRKERELQRYVDAICEGHILETIDMLDAAIERAKRAWGYVPWTERMLKRAAQGKSESTK